MQTIAVKSCSDVDGIGKHQSVYCIGFHIDNQDSHSCDSDLIGSEKGAGPGGESEKALPTLSHLRQSDNPTVAHHSLLLTLQATIGERSSHHNCETCKECTYKHDQWGWGG